MLIYYIHIISNTTSLPRSNHFHLLLYQYYNISEENDRNSEAMAFHNGVEEYCL